MSQSDHETTETTDATTNRTANSSTTTTSGDDGPGLMDLVLAPLPFTNVNGYGDASARALDDDWVPPSKRDTADPDAESDANAADAGFTPESADPVLGVDKDETRTETVDTTPIEESSRPASAGEDPVSKSHDLTAITGVGNTRARTLRQAGFETVGDIHATDPVALTKVNGIGKSRAEDLLATVEAMIGPTEVTDARDVTAISGVGEARASALREAGFETVHDVRVADPDALIDVQGIGPVRARELKTTVEEMDVPTEQADGDETATATDESPTMTVEFDPEEPPKSESADVDADESGSMSEADAAAARNAGAGKYRSGIHTPEHAQSDSPPLDTKTYQADLVAPASLRRASDHARTGDIYTKTVYIEDYPKHARPGMFEDLFAGSGVDIDVAIHITSHDRVDAIGHLREAIKDLEVRIAQKDKGGDVTVRDSVRRLDEHEAVYESLTTGQDESYDVGFYVTLRANDTDTLEEEWGRLRDALKTRQITAKPANYQQQDGLVTTSPLGDDRLNRTTPMLGRAVGAMYPFSATSIVEEEGILMGYHALTDSPLVADSYQRANYNVVVVGTLGGGKSFFEKLRLLRRRARAPDTIVIIIDPRGEFGDLVDALGGDHIPVGGNCPLNPLEIEAAPEHVREEIDAWDYDPFKQARTSAMDVFDSFFEMHNSGEGTSLSAERRSVLGFALDVAYALYGITPDPATHDNESPVIPDVRGVLGAISRNPTPFVRLANAGVQATPEVVADLPGIDPRNKQVLGSETAADAPVERLPAVDATVAEDLQGAGIETIGELAEADPAELTRTLDVRLTEVDAWIEQAVTPDAFVSTSGAGKAPAVADGGETASAESAAAGDSLGVNDTDFEVTEEEVSEWKNHATGLRLALQPFRPGGSMGHLSQPTEIDITKSNLIHLDFEADDTETEMSLMTKVLFNAVYERAKTTDKRVVLPIDEAWRLIKNSESLTWLEQGTRFSRHHDLSIHYITQTLDEFYEREDAKFVIDNCATKILHRLEGLTDEQAKYLELSDREKNFVRTATPGEAGAGYSQALLMVQGKGNFPLRVEPFQAEVPLIEPEARENIPGMGGERQ